MKTEQQKNNQTLSACRKNLLEALHNEGDIIAKNQNLSNATTTQVALGEMLTLGMTEEGIENSLSIEPKFRSIQSTLNKYCEHEATLVTPEKDLTFFFEGRQLSATGLTIPIYGDIHKFQKWENKNPEKVNKLKELILDSVAQQSGIPREEVIDLTKEIKLFNYNMIVGMSAESRRNLILASILKPESISGIDMKSLNEAKKSKEEVLIGAWCFTVFFIHNDENVKAMKKLNHNQMEYSIEKEADQSWTNKTKKILPRKESFVLKYPQSHLKAAEFLTKMMLRKWGYQINHYSNQENQGEGLPYINLEKMKNEDMAKASRLEVFLELHKDENQLMVQVHMKHHVQKHVMNLNPKLLEFIEKEDLYEAISSSFRMPDETWNLNQPKNWNFNTGEGWFSVINRQEVNIFSEEGTIVSFNDFKKTLNS